jgi:indolepyruvate decarboxylase
LNTFLVFKLTTDPEALKSASDAVLAALGKAHSASILPGVLTVRAGLREELQSFVDASGLPFATMFGDKSTLEEQQPAYIGMYDGKLVEEPVREFVESCDCVFVIGALMTDFNTGAFTAHLDPERTIDIRHHHTLVGSKVYPNVEMREILAELTGHVTKRTRKPSLKPGSLGAIAGRGSDPITADALYSRWANFLKPNDILITETGSSSMGLGFAPMPNSVTFHNQTLWGSIGWATPASFGAAVAAPNRRVVLVTGEGSHIVYNDLASWRYSELPHALGCEGWFTARVTTCWEFDKALKAAADENSAAYIEVVTDKYAASPFAMKLHENVKTLCRS